MTSGLAGERSMSSIYTDTHAPSLSGRMWSCPPKRHKGSWEWSGQDGGGQVRHWAYYCTWEPRQAPSVSSFENGGGGKNCSAVAKFM